MYIVMTEDRVHERVTERMRERMTDGESRGRLGDGRVRGDR